MADRDTDRGAHMVLSMSLKLSVFLLNLFIIIAISGVRL